MESIRDKLAFERTKLANERTLLAYVRTSLALIAGAVVLLQFFSSIYAYEKIALVLVCLGVMILGVGIYRFRTVSAELKRGFSAVKSQQLHREIKSKAIDAGG